VSSIYIREDQAEIRIALDGVPLGGLSDVWATLSDGVKTATDAKTRPGGMGKEVSCGGPATRANLTATIQFDEILATNHTIYEARSGKGACEVNVVWLDTEDIALAGSGFKRKGKLLSVAEPNIVNTDSPAVGMYTLIMGCDEESAS
jgi:hypothetical protein